MPTPNPTSVPAPQEQPQMFKKLSARDWMQQTGEYATEVFADYGEEFYNSMIATMDEFAEAVLIDALPSYAKADRLKLAEEAERIAGDVSNYTEWTWKNVAAWLREKSQ